MKYVTIFGSVGVNIGDDLMNRVVCNACHRAGLTPQVASIKPNETSALYSEITFPSSIKKFYKWIPAIKRSSLVVLGGGTLIQNDFNGRVSGILIYSAAAILLSRLILRKKVIAVGLGINKVNRLNSIIAKAFQYCEAIYVRDDKSVENAKLLGLTKVFKTPDIGLGLTPPNIAELLTTHNTSNANYVCLSLVRENIEDISLNVGRAVIKTAKMQNLRIKAICMDTREEEEKSVYRKLQDEFGDLIELVEVKSPNDLLPLLSHSKLNIGMRLHFSVLSLLCKQNPIVLSRESKTDWIQQLFPNSTSIDVFSQSLKTQLEHSFIIKTQTSNSFESKDIQRLDQYRQQIEAVLHHTLTHA